MKAKTVASPRYLRLADRGDRRASSRWFGVLGRVGEFHLLDAYQLVKHYLGLVREFGERPLTLVYFYWEPANADTEPVFAHHRAEIERFASLVAGDKSCNFVALSYPEHWDELRQLSDKPTWLESHLEALAKRYLVAV